MYKIDCHLREKGKKKSVSIQFIYIKYLGKGTKNLIALVVCRNGNELVGMRTERGERFLTVYTFI